MPELSTICDYMRGSANLLGARILEQFPALYEVHDPLSPASKDCCESLFRRKRRDHGTRKTLAASTDWCGGRGMLERSILPSSGGATWPDSGIDRSGRQRHTALASTALGKDESMI